MYNWSVDLKNLRKDDEAYKIWKLTQTINFGLDGEKIAKKELQKYWLKIDIDPNRRKLLALLLEK
jgi:hypothetical protein